MEQQVLRLGLFQSIRPTIKYQSKKANIVADVLSRSQQSDAQEPPPISAMAEDKNDQD